MGKYHGLQPFLQGSGGFCIPKGIVIGPYNHDRKICYLKFLIGRVWEKEGMGGGSRKRAWDGGGLQSFLLVKK